MEYPLPGRWTVLSLELHFKTPVAFRLALTAFLIVLARALEMCLAHLALRETLAIFKKGFTTKAVANITTSTALKDVLLPDKLAEGYSKFFLPQKEPWSTWTSYVT